MEFWWCLKRQDPQTCTFGALGLSCETPETPKAFGVSHDSPRARTCTFEGPGLQKHHQNSTRRPPREREKKSDNGDGGGGKKSESLGGPAEWRRWVRRRGLRGRVGPVEEMKKNKKSKPFLEKKMRRIRPNF